MLKNEMQLSFTYYSPLYHERIPQDHFFRRLKETIDNSFVNDKLKEIIIGKDFSVYSKFYRNKLLKYFNVELFVW
jgi:peptide subunit release factor 1 (eRF1)